MRVLVAGPNGHKDALFVLDTGTPESVINADLAADLGYTYAMRSSFITAQGVAGRQMGYRFPALRVVTLGMDISPCSLICEPLPDDVHGLIGLDLLRERVLTLDFVHGALTLVG